MARPLGEVVDDIGLGCAQARIMVSGGGIYLVAGAFMIVLMVALDPIVRELGLDSHVRGAFSSCLFLGKLSGNFLSGLSDVIGRRDAILLAYVISLFGIAALASSHLAILVGLCYWLLGGSVSFGVPAWNALCTETSPTRWRLQINGFSMLLWPVGQLYSVYFMFNMDPSLRDLPWRRLMLLTTIPGIVILSLLPFLGFLESPRFHYVRQEQAETMQVLEKMRSQNNRPDVSLELIPCEVPPSAQDWPILAQLRVIFGKRFFHMTLIQCYAIFVINFISYGGMYALPLILRGVELPFVAAANLAMIALFDIVGVSSSMHLGHILSRTAMMMTYLLGSLSGMAIFLAGAGVVERGAGKDHHLWMMQLGLYLCTAFNAIGWLTNYQYLGEVYPTHCRSTACGICMGFGRIAGVLVGPTFEWLLHTTGSYLTFYFLMATMCVLNIFLTLILVNTKDIQVPDFAEEATFLVESKAP